MGDKIESKKAPAESQGFDGAGAVLGVIERCPHAGADRRRDRLSRDDQGLRRRRRQGHAHRLRASEGGRGLLPGALGSQVLLRRRSRASSRSSSSTRAISRSRCSATSTATSSISASANARSSAATRRWWKRRPRRSSTRPRASAMGEQAVALSKAVELRFSAGTVEFVAGQDKLVLLPRNEHTPAGRTSCDGAGHRYRSRGADDPRGGLWSRSSTHQAVGPGEAEGLGGREPHLCGRSLPQLPALHRPPDDAIARRQEHSAGGRRHRAQRYRRVRGRRDLACTTIR